MLVDCYIFDDFIDDCGVLFLVIDSVLNLLVLLALEGRVDLEVDDEKRVVVENPLRVIGLRESEPLNHGDVVEDVIADEEESQVGVEHEINAIDDQLNALIHVLTHVGHVELKPFEVLLDVRDEQFLP